jgi:hypothetical protein
MCAGVSLSWREIPTELLDRHQLRDRIIVRREEADWEARFLFRDERPLLPVWHGERLAVYPWGNRNGRSNLPLTGWARQERLDSGRWADLHTEPVEIPATFGYEKGVWFVIQGAIRGLLVRDEDGCPHVYMLTEPASHYYKIMTRSDRMPVLVGRRI